MSFLSASFMMWGLAGFVVSMIVTSTGPVYPFDKIQFRCSLLVGIICWIFFVFYLART